MITKLLALSCIFGIDAEKRLRCSSGFCSSIFCNPAPDLTFYAAIMRMKLINQIEKERLIVKGVVQTKLLILLFCTKCKWGERDCKYNRVPEVDKFTLITTSIIKCHIFKSAPLALAGAYCISNGSELFSSCAGNSSWIPVSKLHRKGHGCDFLKAISPPWEAARVEARSRLCWLARRPGWVRNSLHGWLCCLCVKERRTERQKEESCGTAHLDTICTEHVTLNWFVEHHEGFWSAQWQAGGLSVLCLPAPAASGRSLSPSFTLKVTAISASPVSLRGRGCPSHCGASSLGGAQLCCSVSMKASACSHLWLSSAGGNLLENITSVVWRWEG